VTKKCGRFDAMIGPDGEEIDFAVQASADDVIFISKEAQSVKSMLAVLERFVNWSRIRVNHCRNKEHVLQVGYWIEARRKRRRHEDQKWRVGS
jgi:hypothetical protein